MVDEVRLRFYVTDHSIYKHYVPYFKYNIKVKSPFRSDSDPSFVVYPKGYWIDFGRASSTRQDGIQLVSDLFDLDRASAIKKIWCDIVLNKDFVIEKNKIKSPVKRFYDIRTRDLNVHELSYWVDNFNVTTPYLDFFNVKALEGLYKKNDLIWTSTPDNPAFVYLYSSNRNAFKIYRPLTRDRDKFRGQENGKLLEGWEQLPLTADEVIIQSSFKDTIVCRKAGYLGFNPTGEASLKIILSRAQEINNRFKKVFVLFDNDVPGRRNSDILCSKTHWTPLFISGFKDPSDSVQATKSYYHLHNCIGNFLTKYYNI